MKEVLEKIEHGLEAIISKYEKWPTKDQREEEMNQNEYTIFKNFFLKEGDKVHNLSKELGLQERFVADILFRLYFIKFRNRGTFNASYLGWLRHFTNNFVQFLSYPYTFDKGFDYSIIDDLKTHAKHPHNYKVVISWAMLHEGLALPSHIARGLSKTVARGNFAVSNKIFLALVEVILQHYPELKECNTKTQPQLDPEVDSDENLSDMEFDPKQLLEENNRLRKEVADANFLRDLIEVQFEEYKNEVKEQEHALLETLRKKFFRDLNSVESNNILDVYAISKYNLDLLRKEGWKPERPEITAALFIFDLLSEFFKRQGLRSEGSIGGTVEITMENAHEYNYAGSEITPETVKRAIMKSPAWYIGQERISKATVNEIRDNK